MTNAERDAFLRTIRADPDNDTPRMIFADWLQDRDGEWECERCGGSGKTHRRTDWVTPAGAISLTNVGDRVCLACDQGRHDQCGRQVSASRTACECPTCWGCPACSGTGRVSNGYADRAEIIRVQCELAELDAMRVISPLGHGNDLAAILNATRDFQIAELCRRERELLTPFEPELSSTDWVDWVSGFPEIGLHCGNIDTRIGEHIAPVVWFSRGFIRKIRLPWHILNDHLAKIQYHPAVVLEEVVLATWPDPVTWREMPLKVRKRGPYHREDVRDYLLEKFPGYQSCQPLSFVVPSRDSR